MATPLSYECDAFIRYALKSGKEMLLKAGKVSENISALDHCLFLKYVFENRFAVPSFNVSNLEMARAVDSVSVCAPIRCDCAISKLFLFMFCYFAPTIQFFPWQTPSRA
jgi:hypothetical protein